MISKQEWERIKFSLLKSTWFGPFSFASTYVVVVDHPQAKGLALGVTLVALYLGHKAQDHFPKVQIWTGPSQKRQIIKEFEAKKSWAAKRLELPEEAIDDRNAKVAKAKQDKEIKIAIPLRPLEEFPANQIFSLKEAIPYMKTTERTFYNTPSKQRLFTKNESNHWVITAENLRQWTGLR